MKFCMTADTMQPRPLYWHVGSEQSKSTIQKGGKDGVQLTSAFVAVFRKSVAASLLSSTE